MEDEIKAIDIRNKKIVSRLHMDVENVNVTMRSRSLVGEQMRMELLWRMVICLTTTKRI